MDNASDLKFYLFMYVFLLFLPSHIGIKRDAMEVAKEAEALILQAAARVNGVSIQLRLGHPIPQFRRELLTFFSQ